MRILHVCLSNFFIDDRAYQENELVSEHVRQGHDVLVLASTQVHDDFGKRSFCQSGEYETSDGAKVIRLPYHPLIPHYLARSLRVHRGVYDIVRGFKPDAILFHGLNAWELVTVARYVKLHPQVVFYADTHTDAINSARSFVSKWILHVGFYRPILHRALPQIRKILCISTITADFARDIYGVPEEKLEFYPLGGHPVADEEYGRRREVKRREMGIGEEEVVFVQSGKQSGPKYLKEALEAFARVPDPRFRFVIAGLLMDEIKDDIEPLVDADSRVTFLGWQKPDDLADLLCAADVYVQPGRQSSTMQTSMCCHCAVVLENLPSHALYVDGNGWLLDDPIEIEAVFEEISANKVNLQDMKSRSVAFARERLDYSLLADRVLS